MIATTTKNGQMVRLTADYQLDVEKAVYTVYCNGAEFEFIDFAPAARVYKQLSRRIEEGDFVGILLDNLVKAARALGYTVRVYNAKEVA